MMNPTLRSTKIRWWIAGLMWLAVAINYIDRTVLSASYWALNSAETPATASPPTRTTEADRARRWVVLMGAHATVRVVGHGATRSLNLQARRGHTGGRRGGFPTSTRAARVTEAGSSTTGDVLSLDKTVLASFTAVKAAATDTLDGVLIKFGTGSILLEGVEKADLHANDFFFV